MSTFFYRGYDADGHRAQGLVQAESPKQARARLSDRGVLTEWIREPEAKPFRLAQRAELYRELSSLVCSGMTMTQALTIMSEAVGDDMKRSGALLRVRDGVEGGESLSAALQSVRAGCSVFEIAAVAAGERSGTLGLLLEELADLLEQQCAVKERIVSALIYPTLVVAFGLVVAGLIMKFLIPKAAEMLKGVDVEVPLITRVMQGLARYFPVVFVFVAVLVAGGLFFWMRRVDRPRRRIALDRLWLVLPVFGPIRVKLCAMRLCRTLALLLDSGVPAVDALSLAGDASGSACTADATGQASDRVRDGASVSEALQNLPLLGGLLVGWAKVGETSGALPKMLRTAAHSLAAQWERRVSRLMSFVEPALILMIGGFVLLVALSVLLPILSISRGLS